MKKWVAGFVVGSFASLFAETVTNNLDVQGGFIYNHGFINPGSLTNGVTFTNAGIRDVTVSAGQLSGVDPETGEAITNAANLLSLKAESLTAVSNITAGGSFIGDGSGISNLNAAVAIPAGSIQPDQLSSSIVAASITTNDIAGWNAGQQLTENIQILNGTVAVTTNLTVQGTISGNGSGLCGVAAGGTEGSLQFNANGLLAGNTNFFMHPVEHKLAFYAPSGTIFRAFKGYNVSDEQLIYSLHRFEDTVELSLFNNGVETLRLRGDGSIYASGSLIVGGLSFGGGSSSGSTGWFIPEEGDLSMGIFTQE